MLKTLFYTFSIVFLTATAHSTVTPAIPNYPLVNQEGKPFQLYDLKGNYLFVSFVYTRCPIAKMCPLTISMNKSIYRKWTKLKSKPGLHFLIVTLDPQFDSAEVLKKFAKNRDLNLKAFTLATGNEQTLSDFASQFNVIGIPSDGMISHNLKSILLDPNLVPVKEYKENEWSPDDVIKDLFPKAKG